MEALVKFLFIACAAGAAHGFSLGATDVVFHLFTRLNPEVSEPLLASAMSIMQATQFSMSRRTIIAIHSHNDNAGGNFNAFMVTSSLATEDVNLISVDWSVGSGMYSQGLGNAPQCGRIIADFINILNQDFGYSTSQIRIVGHGIGGHIAGIAARHVAAGVPHIIAIDPSFHGWSHHPERLNPDDADVVEVLHATAGNLGYDYPLGDLDFYPNGGSFQNGCGADVSCSTSFAYIFYAESITRDVTGGERFVGTACDSYEDAIAQQCSGERDVHFGGSEVKSGVSGIYWFATNTMSPFARG